MDSDIDAAQPKEVSDRALGRLFQAVSEEKPAGPLAAYIELENREAGKNILGLPVPGVYRIGRKMDCDIRFSPITDTLVSGLHAELRIDDGFCELRDLGSKNGTYAGSRRIDRPLSLQGGEVIEFGAGGPRLRFHAPSREKPMEQNSTWPARAVGKSGAKRLFNWLLIGFCLAMAAGCLAMAFLLK